MRGARSATFIANLPATVDTGVSPDPHPEWGMASLEVPGIVRRAGDLPPCVETDRGLG